MAENHKTAKYGPTSKPYRDAAEAADDLHDVVTWSICNGYKENMPHYFRHGIAYAWWETFALASAFYTAPGFMAAGYYFAQAGLPIISVILGVATLPMAIGPAGHIMYNYCKEKRPSVQLEKINKKLLSVAAKMPDPEGKSLLQEFSLAARQSFALGRIADMQQKIVENGEEPESVRAKWNKEGLSLIDKAAHDLHLHGGAADDLRSAFSRHALPDPYEYKKALDERYSLLQKYLRKSVEEGFPQL